MSLRLDASATIPVRPSVYSPQGGSTSVGNTSAIDMKIKDVLVAAFSAIPSQAAGTATVAAIVTALNTLP